MNYIQKCASCGILLTLTMATQIESFQEIFCNEKCRLLKAPHTVEINGRYIYGTLSSGVTSMSGTTSIVGLMERNIDVLESKVKLLG